VCVLDGLTDQCTRGHFFDGSREVIRRLAGEVSQPGGRGRSGERSSPVPCSPSRAAVFFLVQLLVMAIPWGSLWAAGEPVQVCQVGLVSCQGSYPMPCWLGTFFEQ